MIKQNLAFSHEKAFSYLRIRKMKLRKLDYSFYDENTHLEQTLDGDGRNKTRGYGIVVIELMDGMTWGIPLHSNLKNDACFVTHTEEVEGEERQVGLNYSKALLLTKPSYISGAKFVIPDEQKDCIARSERTISREFEKYVRKYIRAVRTSNARILNSREYRFTTLSNYKMELGL